MGAATRTNRAFVMPHSPSMGSFRDSRTAQPESLSARTAGSRFRWYGVA
jgi:hypothetical protein